MAIGPAGGIPRSPRQKTDRLITWEKAVNHHDPFKRRFLIGCDTLDDLLGGRVDQADAWYTRKLGFEPVQKLPSQNVLGHDPDDVDDESEEKKGEEVALPFRGRGRKNSFQRENKQRKKLNEEAQGKERHPQGNQHKKARKEAAAHLPPFASQPFRSPDGWNCSVQGGWSERCFHGEECNGSGRLMQAGNVGEPGDSAFRFDG